MYLELFRKDVFYISRITFIVLDNTRIHKTKDTGERILCWQKKGLFLFFLPPYLLHLNIVGTFWRKLQKEEFVQGIS
ncbi:transposase [Odoribacter laneus]|uniref:transposase n=1 Tax=Odoribacter laneus TaxID=626933 RepID=UPI00345C26C1